MWFIRVVGIDYVDWLGGFLSLCCSVLMVLWVMLFESDLLVLVLLDMFLNIVCGVMFL